jgi:hypothetical protein
MNLREVVARAMYERPRKPKPNCASANQPKAWGEITEANRETWRRNADAAIEAIGQYLKAEEDARRGAMR